MAKVPDLEVFISLHQTEAQFQSAVIQYAELKGWLVYHTHDSRRSQPGFPDLTMVRNGRLIFAEVKREDGVTTDKQTAWLIDLRQVADDIEENILICPPISGIRHAFLEVHLWRPSDWHEIERVLA